MTRRRYTAQGLGQVKRPYHKIYNPPPVAHIMGTIIRGHLIDPGTIVTVTAHYGPFRIIEDGEGNQVSVGKGTLVPLNDQDRLLLRLQERSRKKG